MRDRECTAAAKSGTVAGRWRPAGSTAPTRRFIGKEVSYSLERCMRVRTVAVLLAVLVIVSGLSYAGWKIIAGPDAHICTACQRPVHRGSQTRAIADGKTSTFCCPACALSQRKQTGRRIDVVSVTNFEDGTTVDPAGTYLVRGSEMSSCSHQMPHLAPDKQPTQAHFDRCSPSILAFSTKAAAVRFAQQHGGEVLPYSVIAAQLR